jgi:transcriptional regulator with XRE-family HTH domain
MMIGTIISELRKEQGLSQIELAQQLGYTQRVISALEREETNPTLQQIERLTTFFNVSADYLLFGKTETTSLIDKEILDAIHSDKSLFDSMVNLAISRRDAQKFMTEFYGRMRRKIALEEADNGIDKQAMAM